jgi:hypothetical protein
MMCVGKWLRPLVVLVLSSVLAACLAAPIEVVDSALVGTWQGECEIDLPVLFDPSQLPAGVERTRTTVPLEFTIYEDAAVAGKFGAATLEESVLKFNLSGPKEYIITDGYLAGAIVPEADATEKKAFAVPFDLVDGHIQGAFMWQQQGKYPFPLCLRLELERSQ